MVKIENVQQRASFGLGVTISWDDKKAELSNEDNVVERWTL